MLETHGEAEGYACVLHQAVDNIRVQTYWQIGERIVRAELEQQDRASYGQEVIRKLAVDLSISERNLYNAVAFYRAYPILLRGRPRNAWHRDSVCRIELVALCGVDPTLCP